MWPGPPGSAKTEIRRSHVPVIIVTSFNDRLLPAFRPLLEAAAAVGKVRGGVEPHDLLRAVASLCTPSHDVGPDHARRMVGLLIDGLRYGAIAP